MLNALYSLPYSSLIITPHNRCPRIMKALILCYLHKLACFSFTDASRRHKSPGSETKDSITCSNHSNIFISAFSCSSPTPIPTGCHKEDHVTPVHAESSLLDGNSDPGKHKSTGYKHTHPLLLKVTLSSKTFHYKHP